MVRLACSSYVFSIFMLGTQLVDEIITGKQQGASFLISSFYYFLIIGYALVVNLVLLINEFRLNRRKGNSPLKGEILSIMMLLQLSAFVPFLLNMEIIYVILYMPVCGLLFFVYLFVRLSTQKTASLHLLMKEKYAASKLKDCKQLDLEKRIMRLMEEEQFFLAEDSSLKAMALKLNETPNCISMIINSRFNQSYSDFINRYRIKLAIDRLTSKNNKLSMEGLALESGFGNRNSFYQAFKKETGTTPSAYIKGSGMTRIKPV